MTETFNESVLIDGSDDATQLRVQGHSTQNASLQTWESSASDVLAQVTSDGRLQFGDDLGFASPDALIEAHRAETSTSKPKRGFHAHGRVSDALNNITQWIVQELEVRGTSSISAVQTALRVGASNKNTGTPASGEIRAADLEVIHEPASAATLPRATGLHVGVTNTSGNTIQEAKGLHVAMVNQGTITTPYAIFTEGAGVTHLDDYLEMKRPTATPGTPATDYVRVYAKSDGKLYAKNWSGTEYDLTSAGGVSAIPGIVNGRLTLATNNPIPTGDVTGAGTLYFTPFHGNQVALFDGTNWVIHTFTERSLSLSNLTANTNYDIFLYDNAGNLTLEAIAWTNDTTRATAHILQDGIRVKNGATGRRYLGTIRTANAGVSQDSLARRFVFNEYNRVHRKLYIAETTYSWTYGTNAWRAVNNNTANRVHVVVGTLGVLVDLRMSCRMDSSGAGSSQSIGYDTTTGTVADLYMSSSTNGNISAHLAHYSAVGYHYYQWVENGRGQTSTFYGVASNGWQSGLVGTIVI